MASFPLAPLDALVLLLSQSWRPLGRYRDLYKREARTYTLQDLGSIRPSLPESGYLEADPGPAGAETALASDGRRAARRRRDSANHTSSGRSSNCAAGDR